MDDQEIMAFVHTRRRRQLADHESLELSMLWVRVPPSPLTNKDVTMNWPLIVMVITFGLYTVLGNIGRHYYMDLNDNNTAVLFFRFQGLAALGGALTLFLLS